MRRSQFDIVTVPELIVCPDAGDRRSASGCPAGSEHWKPSDLDDDLHRRVGGIYIPLEVCTEGHELPQDSEQVIVFGAVGLAAQWFLTG